MRVKPSNITHMELSQWVQNPLVNPRTKRKIKVWGPVFKCYFLAFQLQYTNCLSKAIKPHYSLEMPFNSLSIIGKGIDGCVWKIEEPLSKQQFALKVFKDKSQWEDEVYIHKIVSHIPNLVGYCDSFSFTTQCDVKKYAIKMPLYDISLYKLVEFKRLNIDEIYHIMTKVATAVKRMHDLGFIHYDIRSTNIFCKLNNIHIEDVALGDYGRAYHPTIKGFCRMCEDDCIFRSEYPTKQIFHASKTRQELWDIYQLGYLLLSILSGQFSSNRYYVEQVNFIDKIKERFHEDARGQALLRLAFLCMGVTNENGFYNSINSHEANQPSINEIITYLHQCK